VFLFEYLLPNRACILNFIAIKEGESIHNYLFSVFPKKKNKAKNTEKTNKQTKETKTNGILNFWEQRPVSEEITSDTEQKRLN